MISLGGEAMKHIDRHELFSIPNLMGYFRILMIPVFCFLYLTAETKQDIWKAAAVVYGCDGPDSPDDDCYGSNPGFVYSCF